MARAARSRSPTAALPAKGSDEEHILIGKDLFNTGRARWSLNGEGWGSCQSCHSDGLTDNVTWFFGRGPRQSTSLDGSFASHEHARPAHLQPHCEPRRGRRLLAQHTRHFGWRGRHRAGHQHASAEPRPHRRQDAQAERPRRLDAASLRPCQPARSSASTRTVWCRWASSTRNPNAKSAGGVLDDWINITRYIQTIRTPRAPTNLDADKVKAGEQLFSQARLVHGLPRWRQVDGVQALLRTLGRNHDRRSRPLTSWCRRASPRRSCPRKMRWISSSC